MIISFNYRIQFSPEEEGEMRENSRTAIESLKLAVESSGELDRRRILACSYEWLVSAPQDVLKWDVGRQGTHRLWFITSWAKNQASMDKYPGIVHSLKSFLQTEEKRLRIRVSPPIFTLSRLLRLGCIGLGWRELGGR